VLPVDPPANTPRELPDVEAVEFLLTDKSPKSVPFPVVAIVK
jgi:hypothetical protein